MFTSQLEETQPSMQTLVGGDACWFAVQTRPRFEKKVALGLEEKGLISFLPLFSALHQWSDRKRSVASPLFPGYVFVRMAETLDTRGCVLRTNGVNRFVGNRGIGTKIPTAEIEAIQATIRAEIAYEQHPYLKIGQKVRVRGGCLDGLEGVLTKINGDRRLIISIDMIERSVAIKISGYNVEAI